MAAAAIGRAGAFVVGACNVSHYTFDRRNIRVAKARLAGRGAIPLNRGALVVCGVAGMSSLALIFLKEYHLAAVAGAITVLTLTLRLWLRRDILSSPAVMLGTSTSLDALLPQDLLARFQESMDAAAVWHLLENHWESRFVMARFDLHPDIIAPLMSLNSNQLDPMWANAEAMAREAGSPTLSVAAITSALLVTEPALAPVLTSIKLDAHDLLVGVAWLARLEHYRTAPKPLYGGIARDWAAGFTPLLSQYGQNLSQQVEVAGSRFGVQERTSQLDSLISGLSSATGSVVVVGEPGIGKTALLYGLADRLLQGNGGGALAHHQVIALNASVILSNQHGAGDLERIVLALMGEAAHAGNIVLALDEAQLFFGQGTGAANLSQVLLPVLQARSIKLVFAVTAADWQRLRASNTALAGLLTPLVLLEPPEEEVVRLLADRALVLERGTYTTTYKALIESYRLSGRYFSDEAYPGKALKLLEAAYTHADGPFVTEVSVQRAIESQLGVKVEQAGADEASVLLDLESSIHARMIGQTRAVQVVSAALRRARAGVSNPKRPIGSFLFLGPTGVGKTELSKSIAALYFGAESSMIRLDMSEFQQSSDVARILAGAAENPQGLLARVRQQPFCVVLFDEIEKADPNILNLMLQLLDEGNLTDSTGKSTSFKDAIIIATSNAGADEIRRHIEAGEALESFEAEFTDSLVSSGQFKPELLNRFDEIVLFRPLSMPELAQVVELLIAEVNHTLATQKITVQLSAAAVDHLVATGYDPRLGARPMRRMVTRTVEDAVAGRILRGQTAPGDVITLMRSDVGGSPETVGDSATPTIVSP